MKPERTPDGRWIVVDGRRWRASDPAIPEDVAATLRRELMSARRAVGAALRAADAEAERRARARVQAAKVALGERGTPWWEQSDAEREARWQALWVLLHPKADGSPQLGQRTTSYSK